MPVPMLPTTGATAWPAGLDARAAADMLSSPRLGYERARERDDALLCMPRRAQEAIRHAAHQHGTTAAQVIGSCQMQTEVRARREAARSMRAMGMSLTEIGRYLHRHHTTVLHLLGRKGCRAIAPPAAYSPDVPDYSGEWAI